MKIIRTVADMQQHADAMRLEGQTLVLVPTMGALHAGHLSLVQHAREHGSHVTVSIFVNPTQFTPGEDFEKYPRPVESDIGQLEELGGVDVLFLPENESMYPDVENGSLTWITTRRLTEQLCGQYREGHFKGVTTVVGKLFNACKPHKAVFGLKDAQQFLVLKRMVQDLNFDVELIGAPTVRESDGLARSSRNVYLSDRERSQAPLVYAALMQVFTRVQLGERNRDELVRQFEAVLKGATDARIQYAELVDVDLVQPLKELRPGQEALFATAVHFGQTRLIDNIFVQAPAG